MESSAGSTPHFLFALLSSSHRWEEPVGVECVLNLIANYCSVALKRGKLKLFLLG